MDLSYKNFADKLKCSKLPVFVECWASWCLPCKQYDSILKKSALKYKEKCEVCKINLDRNPQASKDYEIKGLPTFMTFLQGEEIERKVGAQTHDILRKMIEKAVSLSLQRQRKHKDDKIIEERLKALGYL